MGVQGSLIKETTPKKGFRVQGLGLGFRVQGLGFGDWGLGTGMPSCALRHPWRGGLTTARLKMFAAAYRFRPALCDSGVWGFR